MYGLMRIIGDYYKTNIETYCDLMQTAPMSVAIFNSLRGLFVGFAFGERFRLVCRRAGDKKFRFFFLFGGHLFALAG